MTTRAAIPFRESKNFAVLSAGLIETVVWHTTCLVISWAFRKPDHDISEASAYGPIHLSVADSIQARSLKVLFPNMYPFRVYTLAALLIPISSGQLFWSTVGEGTHHESVQRVGPTTVIIRDVAQEPQLAPVPSSPAVADRPQAKRTQRVRIVGWPTIADFVHEVLGFR